MIFKFTLTLSLLVPQIMMIVPLTQINALRGLIYVDEVRQLLLTLCMCVFVCGVIDNVLKKILELTSTDLPVRCGVTLIIY